MKFVLLIVNDANCQTSGGSPTISSPHLNDHNNFLRQLSGEKMVFLFPPSDQKYLYYTARRKGKWVYAMHPTLGAFKQDGGSVSSSKVVFELYEHARWSCAPGILCSCLLAATWLNVAINFCFSTASACL